MKLAACLSLLFVPRLAFGACAMDRGPVKSATDAQAAQVSLVAMPTAIATLHSIPAPRPLPQDGRLAPVETTIYAVTATLTAYRVTPDGEIQLVLSDDARRTITATIPAPSCTGGSRFLSLIANARGTFGRRYAPTDAFKEVRQAIEVQGIGFFDFVQGQRGLAPNAISLHPVTAIDFTPSFQPKAPPAAVRRRSVGSGSGSERGCARPTLSITASRGSACSGTPVTIAWQASDPAAKVTIDGIGVALPAAGSRVVTVTSSAAYSGRATTSCGLGDEAVAVVTLTSAATASLSGPASVTSGSSAMLTVATSAATSWTLSSSLGNSISPASGTFNTTATYAASRTGLDTVTLTASGGACGSVSRTLTILVNAAPTTDPPANTGLRCCDGTRSSTCFSCANKRGCCSGHGGVCGCS
jgi:hypothetical protein